MSADLTARARSAVTVKEECDVIRDAVWETAPGEAGLQKIRLLDAVRDVRADCLPRAVLLGVVAALVPEGMGWGVNGPFIHADGATHWEATCGPLDEIAGRTPALALLIAILEASHAGS